MNYKTITLTLQPLEKNWLTMAKEDLLPYQQNLDYRREFKRLDLDLEAVMEFAPLDLDMENRRLKSLLDFVHEYQRCGSKATMEVIAGNYRFPPIFPGISPESDWYRFELWMQGEPVRKKLSAQLPQNTVFRKPAEINDEEIESELERLEQTLKRAGYGIGLNDGIPARLVYAFLYEELGEEFELYESDGFGSWSFDGCSGYCPGCFQRPWCKSGQNICWSEDKEAGKMHLTEELNDYVSASPQSLEILQQLQAEEAARFAKFKAENPSPDFGNPGAEEDRQARLN